jgi:hypothetical protein
VNPAACRGASALLPDAAACDDGNDDDVGMDDGWMWGNSDGDDVLGMYNVGVGVVSGIVSGDPFSSHVSGGTFSESLSELSSQSSGSFS